MADLQDRLGPPLLNGLRQIPKPRDELIRISPQLPLVGLAFFFIDITILHDDQARPSSGPLGVIIDQLSGNDPVRITEPGEHRGHDHAVPQGQVLQAKGLRQMGKLHFHSFWIADLRSQILFQFVTV